MNTQKSTALDIEIGEIPKAWDLLISYIHSKELEETVSNKVDIKAQHLMYCLSLAQEHTLLHFCIQTIKNTHIYTYQKKS